MHRASVCSVHTRARIVPLFLPSLVFIPFSSLYPYNIFPPTPSSLPPLSTFISPSAFLSPRLPRRSLLSLSLSLSLSLLPPTFPPLFLFLSLFYQCSSLFLVLSHHHHHQPFSVSRLRVLPWIISWHLLFSLSALLFLHSSPAASLFFSTASCVQRVVCVYKSERVSCMYVRRHRTDVSLLSALFLRLSFSLCFSVELTMYSQLIEFVESTCALLGPRCRPCPIFLRNGRVVGVTFDISSVDVRRWRGTS